MKKIIVSAVVLTALLITFQYCHAQETPVPGSDQQAIVPTPAKPPEPTLQELQWQAAFLAERLKNMQYEYTQLQDQQKSLQADIVKRTPPPKKAEEKKPDPKK